MSTQVVPKTYSVTGDVRLHYTEHGAAGDVLIECRAGHPPSAEGRTVYLRLDPEMVTLMLRTLRDVAIAARGTTEPERLSIHPEPQAVDVKVCIVCHKRAPWCSCGIADYQ